MNNDIKILRKLAFAYREAAMEPRNEQRRILHTASNDLKMLRPVVLIDELPWNEMELDGELTLQCEDVFLRSVEDYMRKTLYRFNNLPADMIVKPYIKVDKVINHSSIGVKIQEETLATAAGNNIISHDYEDQFSSDTSIEKLKDVVVSYDKIETMRRYELLGNIIGDILPIRVCGVSYVGVVTWDDIAMYRGVTPLLMDLVERPEFCHALTHRLTQIKERVMDQYESLELFDLEGDTLHCTPFLTSDLPTKEGKTGKPLTRKDVWGRGTAQIFASVGKAMHKEFDIDYMQKTIGTCGLSYYGCCEPLDKKMDIVEKLKNLRKVSITPWADVDIAAEAIGRKYVLSSKPNPASVACQSMDENELKKEINRILSACKRNNCNVDITLKDISTCNFRPQNIFTWEKIIMEMVENYS